MGRKPVQWCTLAEISAYHQPHLVSLFIIRKPDLSQNQQGLESVPSLDHSAIVTKPDRDRKCPALKEMLSVNFVSDLTLNGSGPLVTCHGLKKEKKKSFHCSYWYKQVAENVL